MSKLLSFDCRSSMMRVFSWISLSSLLILYFSICNSYLLALVVLESTMGKHEAGESIVTGLLKSLLIFLDLDGWRVLFPSWMKLKDEPSSPISLLLLWVCGGFLRSQFNGLRLNEWSDNVFYFQLDIFNLLFNRSMKQLSIGPNMNKNSCIQSSNQFS